MRTSKATSRTTSRAFTFVELLVVIAIIAILIGVLLPTLAGARRRASAIKCASNMRQIGQTLYLYADRNSGWIPRDATVGAVDHPAWPLLIGALVSSKKESITEADLKD